MDRAAVLSGQAIPGNSSGGSPQQGIPLIQAWARVAQDIIGIWQGYLSGDRDDLIDLTEITGLKVSVQSLRKGLTKYLFEDSAELRNAEPDAWAGIQKHWILIKLNCDSLWDEIVDYRDWMIVIDERGDQITDPIAMRKMARQMRRDMRIIVNSYAKLIDNLMPVIKEILEFP